jgi:hypothetical protein
MAKAIFTVTQAALFTVLASTLYFAFAAHRGRPPTVARGGFPCPDAAPATAAAAINASQQPSQAQAEGAFFPEPEERCVPQPVFSTSAPGFNFSGMAALLGGKVQLLLAGVAPDSAFVASHI